MGVEDADAFGEGLRGVVRRPGDAPDVRVSGGHTVEPTAHGQEVLRRAEQARAEAERPFLEPLADASPSASRVRRGRCPVSRRRKRNGVVPPPPSDHASGTAVEWEQVNDAADEYEIRAAPARLPG
ncbi:hypothetical protein AB0L59_18325 [Streptomyces sp. NPDC052109]|uniref:hypothetical protein n=1 Tax=Streptomyces sp. NPDC052109 TaxID=3155527 RepID=UPI0034321E4A